LLHHFNFNNKQEINNVKKHLKKNINKYLKKITKQQPSTIDVNSTMYEPGDFSFVKGAMSRRALTNAHNAVSELNLWDFFKNESPPKDTGYMFWNHDNMQKLIERLDEDGHSGASFAVCMRHIETIAKSGWTFYVNQNVSSL